MGNYLKDLILQGENQHLDFKYCITDSKKIARSLVAFSNSGGGTLLIGVKDNGAVAGVRSDEEFYMVDAAAKMYSRPEIRFTFRTWPFNGKTVLEVTVPKSDQRPHYAPDSENQWKVYIRVKDQNLIANRILLKVWEKEKRKKGIFIRFTEKEKLLLQLLEHDAKITLSHLAKTAHIPRFKAENILINLICIGIIDMEFTEKGIWYTLSPDAEEKVGELRKSEK